jgi:hypothetical protein
VTNSNGLVAASYMRLVVEARNFTTLSFPIYANNAAGKGDAEDYATQLATNQTAADTLAAT